MLAICRVGFPAEFVVIPVTNIPSGSTAMEKKGNGVPKLVEKFREDPGICSSRPEAALKPPTSPVKLSAKNHSDALFGGRLFPEPSAQALVSAASSITANSASLEINACLRQALRFPARLRRGGFVSPHITHPISSSQHVSHTKVRLRVHIRMKPRCCLFFLTPVTKPRGFITQEPTAYPNVPVTNPPSTSAT